MSRHLEVTFAPAEFQALPSRDLRDTACVVFDVLRATSSMITALHSGAEAIRPVSDIPEAIRAHQTEPGTLLAGERDGVRIRAEQTGGMDFHLGNSPREFTPSVVRGKTVIMTTTNGTRALRAAAHGAKVLVGSLLNLNATARFLRDCPSPGLLIVCGGTFEEMAYEDVLAAGALCARVWPEFTSGRIADSALMARALFEAAASDLVAALGQSRNGRRLLSRPELRDDVRCCGQVDAVDLAARLDPDGLVRRVG